ncbi:MAG TPA: S41 family peptidase [Ignavibacteriaceae bacterium]|nr:S41 family peptidase [Ignavibacteriaceae bacterium]
MKKLKRKLLIIFIASGSLILTGFFASKSDIYFEIAKNMELLGKVYKEISFNYVDNINPQEFMRAGIKGMLSTLDPYTIFVDESKQQDIDLMTNGKYGGIGVSIGVRGDNVTIVEVVGGYSAQKQGIRVGDIIIEAGGVKISPKNVDEVSSLVKGEPGTYVDLKILRQDSQDTLLFSIVREEIKLKNVTYAGFFPENRNNVYIKLSNFSRSAGDELRNSLKSLSQEKNIESIILDLRGNPGGLLDAAVDVCEKFLAKDQLVVSTKGREENSIKKYYSKQLPIAHNEKLVVLINGSSASASEIVAGAIQDHDRGIILGTQSFGKGLVQTIIPLTNNTSLKITTAKYFTPSGRSIQKIDYSKDNPAIQVTDSILVDLFQTDNKRAVYSAGGISPDTTVEVKNVNELIQQLLARGLIFSFADKYFYENPDADFHKIDGNKIIESFRFYLKEKDFTYTSSLQKKFNEVLSEIDKNSDDLKIQESLESLRKQFDGVFDKDFKAGSSGILSELKAELASRYRGVNESLEERLQSDNQVKVALEIINNDSIYNKLLNKP